MIIYYPVTAPKTATLYAHLTVLIIEETDQQTCENIFNEILDKTIHLNHPLTVYVKEYDWFGDDKQYHVAKIVEHSTITEMYEIVKSVLQAHNQKMDIRETGYSPHITLNEPIVEKQFHLGPLLMSHKRLGT